MNASLAAPKPSSVAVALERQRQVAGPHLGAGVQPLEQPVLALGAEADLGERLGDLALGVPVVGEHRVDGSDAAHGTTLRVRRRVRRGDGRNPARPPRRAVPRRHRAVASAHGRGRAARGGSADPSRRARTADGRSCPPWRPRAIPGRRSPSPSSAALLAVASGAGPLGVARLALVFLVGQLSIGWSNDWVDAARDAAVARAGQAGRAGTGGPAHRRPRRAGRRAC